MNENTPPLNRPAMPGAVPEKIARRVELPTLEEIDNELDELADRIRWLKLVRRLVVKLELKPDDPDGC